MQADSITHDLVLSMVHYDPATGIFTYKTSGKVASYVNPKGYIYVAVGKRTYRAHRLAWFYVHGVWPADQIDHINGNRADNRISNLREATSAENNQNRRLRSDSTSGLTGASPDGNKWKAQIRINGKKIYLGLYKTPEEAHAAYKGAKVLAHSFNPYM